MRAREIRIGQMAGADVCRRLGGFDELSRRQGRRLDLSHFLARHIRRCADASRPATDAACGRACDRGVAAPVRDGLAARLSRALRLRHAWLGAELGA